MNLVRIPTKWYNPHDTIKVATETILQITLRKRYI